MSTETLPPLPERYFAAIDLGSNSCRFLVVEKQNNTLQLVDAFSRVIRLSEGLTQSSSLSKAAMQRAFSVLEQCVKKSKLYAPLSLRCVATEACRKAHNSAGFLNRVKEKLGLDFTIISEQEEARLAVRGCSHLLDRKFPYALLFDIGGASSEIIWIQVPDLGPPRIIDMISLPFGVVTLAEAYDIENAAAYASVVETVHQAIENFSGPHEIYDRILEGKVQMIGSSGTATIVGGIHLGLHFYDRSKVDGVALKFEDIQNTIKQIQLMTIEERNQHPCIGPDRSDLTLGGIGILEAMCRAWPIDHIQVADRGVRDGIVSELAFGTSEKPRVSVA